MKIKILNLEFEVIEKECVMHGSEAVGQIEHLEQVIEIKKGLSKERKQQILLHEIIHSCFEQLGYRKEHDDEHLIDIISTSLCLVLRDNPHIFRE